MTTRKRSIAERPLRYADEPPIPCWPTFIEKLLLAIIDANPPDSRAGQDRAADPERRRRLSLALEGLFGLKRSRGRKEIYLLHAAVAAARMHAPAASMAAFERIVLKWPKSERTKRIAKNAAYREHNELTAGNSANSRADRLKDFEAEHSAYLELLGLGYPHPEEEDMCADLHMVAGLLRSWGVEMTVDPEALGLASLWGPNRPLITPQQS